MSITTKIPFIGKEEKYTTKVNVWRRRGDNFQPELHDAVRYRYEDRPNAHVLDSGEEIPAVPLEYIYTMSDGTPYFEVVEVEDGQYAPKEKYLNSEEFDPEKDFTQFEAQEITDFDGLVPVKPIVDKKGVSDTIINNKDQRLNFWLDHLKESSEKYGAFDWIAEHMNLILVVVTAVAVAIIMYTGGDFSDIGRMINDLNSNVVAMNENLEALFQNNEDLTPPGN